MERLVDYSEFYEQIKSSDYVGLPVPVLYFTRSPTVLYIACKIWSSNGHLRVTFTYHVWHIQNWLSFGTHDIDHGWPDYCGCWCRWHNQCHHILFRVSCGWRLDVYLKFQWVTPTELVQQVTLHHSRFTWCSNMFAQQWWSVSPQ